MLQVFELVITYGTIAVFDPSLSDPFNDWADEHITQGFSWRPESVSFRTLDSGRSQVKVQRADDIQLDPNTQRAILVPFSVGSSGLIEVASISEGQQVNIPEGKYGLLFETGYSDDIMWCHFTFVPDENAEARILRADAELTPTYPLLMDAQPARP